MKKFILTLVMVVALVAAQAQSNSYRGTLKKYMEASGSLGLLRLPSQA